MTLYYCKCKQCDAVLSLYIMPFIQYYSYSNIQTYFAYAFSRSGTQNSLGWPLLWANRSSPSSSTGRRSSTITSTQFPNLHMLNRNAPFCEEDIHIIQSLSPKNPSIPPFITYIFIIFLFTLYFYFLKIGVCFFSYQYIPIWNFAPLAPPGGIVRVWWRELLRTLWTNSHLSVGEIETINS